jgi:hypothetical protein
MDYNKKELENELSEFVKANRKIKRDTMFDEFPESFKSETFDVAFGKTFYEDKWGFILVYSLWIEDCPEDFDEDDENFSIGETHFIPDEDSLTTPEIVSKVMYELNRAIKKGEKTLWKKKE